MILHPDACLEVRFGFKKKIDSLSEGSVPVIFISMVPPEKSQDKEKFRSARRILPNGKPALIHLSGKYATFAIEPRFRD